MSRSALRAARGVKDGLADLPVALDEAGEDVGDGLVERAGLALGAKRGGVRDDAVGELVRDDVERGGQRLVVAAVAVAEDELVAVEEGVVVAARVVDGGVDALVLAVPAFAPVHLGEVVPGAGDEGVRVDGGAGTGAAPSSSQLPAGPCCARGLPGRTRRARRLLYVRVGGEPRVSSSRMELAPSAATTSAAADRRRRRCRCRPRRRLVMSAACTTVPPAASTNDSNSALPDASLAAICTRQASFTVCASTG